MVIFWLSSQRIPSYLTPNVHFYMKKLFLSAACALGLLAAQSASAQYYLVSNANANTNPGGLNTDDEYPVGGGLGTGWTTLLTGTAATLATPVWSPQAAIPFGFQFNGQPVTDFKVATSGVLTFNTSATTVPSATNAALPSAQIPDQSVCVWGMGAAAGDFIITKTFGTAPNRQHWIQFNSYTKPGNATAFTYWSIVLEEGSNSIYVVDQRSSATNVPSVTVGVQIDGATAVQVPASPAVNSLTAGDPTPADNTYYAFNPGTPPARDLKVTSLNLPTVASRQNPIPVGGGVLNLGTDPVTSYTVNYQVNNGTPVSGLVTGVNLASQATGTFNHPTPWQPTSGGNYSLKVWLSDPNGAVDQNPRNDTLRATVFVGDSTMQRKVVEEDFTSSTCNPCRAGNINTHTINTAAVNRGKFVEIKYQQNFPAPGNDPYYTAESGARFDFYDGSYIPYMLLDGGWNENSQSYTAAVLNQYYSKPAIMRVSGTYTLTGTTISARAAVRPFLGFPAGRLVAHAVVIETETRNNARTNGETVFYNVMKKMMPNENGTVLPALNSGQSYSLNQSFDVATLPTAQAVENLNNLRVVVFVQDVVTKEVYQGEILSVRGGLSTRNDQAGPSFVLAPNPTTGSTRLLLNLDRPETVTVEVLDALGRTVLSRPQVALGAGAQEVNLNLMNRAAGIYTVRLTSTQGVRTSKLTVE
jgi:hypothetical protein